jgi:hypothetical protein
MLLTRLTYLMRAKQFVPIVEAQQELFEVKMSPGSLKKLAGGIDALVGIEFEMIVPDVGNVDDEDSYGDPEEDMDYDQMAYDIDDIVSFFNDGDYNDRSTIRDLEEELREKFYEWQSEQIRRSWIDEDGKDYFAKWVRENVSTDDVADHVGKEEDLFGDREPTKEDWEKFIEDEWESEDSNYDSAYDEFFEEKQTEGDFDETEFLRDTGIRYMSDVNDNVREYISWPHYTYPEEGGDPEGNLEQLADEFSEAIGRKVHYSTGYHGGPRTDDAYTIEPDSSLSGSGDDAGLEFISPPLPLDQAIEDVKKVKEWADERGAYTNRSTGLHMNVSVPGFNQDNLDFVKLTLLLGDRYLLDRFGRSANTYCKSAMDIIEEAPSAQDKELLFKKLKNNLETMASKVIHSGRVGKFTSINPKDNRVEFRGPGGDWLGENFDKIEDTLYRTVVALDAAVDPEKYRKEYLKKLTKMFAPTKGSLEDVFVQYASGSITREELKNKLKTTQAQRKQEKYKAEGIVEVEFYQAENGDWIIEYDNPTGNNRRIFLKRTEQVSDDNKALRAAIELEPSWFKPDDIENIIVSEYSGLKSYAITERGSDEVIQVLDGVTPLQALDRAIYANNDLANKDLIARPAREVQQQPLRMAPDETEFVIINNTLNQRVSLGARDSATALSRALRNNPSWDSYLHSIRVLSATPQSQEDEPYKLYRVRGNQDSRYISARSVGEAGRIAITVYPELGDTVDSLDIVLQDAAQGVIDSYLRSQQTELERRNNTSNWRDQLRTHVQSTSDGLTSGQPGEGERYIVSQSDGSGSVVVRGTSPENAIERARAAFNIPADRELEANLYV